jgi:hypothetical protein
MGAAIKWRRGAFPLPVKWSYRNSVLVVETIGQYERDEIQSALAAARADPQFVPETRVLFDGRLSEMDVSTPDIDWRVQLAASLQAMGFSRTCAVVVRDKAVTFGMGRMLSLRLENQDVELSVTRDFDEAMRSLTGRSTR